MSMKTVILTATLIASVLVSAIGANAADRTEKFDGAKFFAEQANRATQ
jgi:hypothetical protein